LALSRVIIKEYETDRLGRCAGVENEVPAYKRVRYSIEHRDTLSILVIDDVLLEITTLAPPVELKARISAGLNIVKNISADNRSRGRDCIRT
jgi:hypothetical protein